MGNHFRFLAGMLPDSDYTDDDINKRFELYYGDDADFCEERIPFFRSK